MFVLLMYRAANTLRETFRATVADGRLVDVRLDFNLIADRILLWWLSCDCVSTAGLPFIRAFSEDAMHREELH